jgi:hypothetical protein
VRCQEKENGKRAAFAFEGAQDSSSRIAVSAMFISSAFALMTKGREGKYQGARASEQFQAAQMKT